MFTAIPLTMSGFLQLGAGLAQQVDDLIGAHVLGFHALSS